MVQASFSSTDHTGMLSSGDGIAAGGGKIEFRTRQPAGAGLLAGFGQEASPVLGPQPCPSRRYPSNSKFG